MDSLYDNQDLIESIEVDEIEFLDDTKLSGDIQLSDEDEAAYKYYEERNPGITRQQYNDRILESRKPHDEKRTNIDEFEDQPDVIENDGLSHEQRRLGELKKSYVDDGYDDALAETLADKDFQIETLKNTKKPIVLSPEDESAYKYYEKRNPGTTRKQYYNKVIKPKIERGM